jgi:hypothetical protein
MWYFWIPSHSLCLDQEVSRRRVWLATVWINSHWNPSLVHKYGAQTIVLMFYVHKISEALYSLRRMEFSSGAFTSGFSLVGVEVSSFWSVLVDLYCKWRNNSWLRSTCSKALCVTQFNWKSVPDIVIRYSYKVICCRSSGIQVSYAT